MPEITSTPDLTALHLVNCIRTSQITSPLAVRDPLPFRSERYGVSTQKPNRKPLKHLLLQTASQCVVCFGVSAKAQPGTSIGNQERPICEESVSLTKAHTVHILTKCQAPDGRHCRNL